MGSLTPNARYIYESPDGGSTVYAREFGSTERKLVGYTYDGEGVYQATPQNQKIKQAQLWHEIHLAAEQDSILKDMLDKIVVYHTLKNTP